MSDGAVPLLVEGLAADPGGITGELGLPPALGLPVVLGPPVVPGTIALPVVPGVSVVPVVPLAVVFVAAGGGVSPLAIAWKVSRVLSGGALIAATMPILQWTAGMV